MGSVQIDFGLAAEFIPLTPLAYCYAQMNYVEPFYFYETFRTAGFTEEEVETRRSNTPNA
ncbi:hypothetical protein LQ777_25500 (plasmid) [Spirosoma oryzicola]|nr:hypothetical protein LQ777_25500 [Spirosoma oryzicola]